MPKSVLARNKGVKIGAIVSFMGSSVPEGFLACDGSILNIEDYPALYSEIGLNNGYGNNDGLTFHLPDLRGRFLRGLDQSSGRDGDASSRIESNPGGNAGDAIGSLQNYAMRDIAGWYQVSGVIASVSGIFSSSTNGSRPSGDSGATVLGGFDADRVVPTSNEFRPENVTVMFIIKVE